MYAWEPVRSPVYTGSVLAEATPGAYYDVLAVEQSNEGWHGFLLKHVVFDEDRGDSELEIMDEQLFIAKYDAVAWCEACDLDKAPEDLEHLTEFDFSLDMPEEEESFYRMLGED